MSADRSQPAAMLVIRTTSSCCDCNAQMDFAVVELGPKLAATIVARMRLVTVLLKADLKLCAAAWTDYACAFGPADAEKLLELWPHTARSLDDNGWAIFTSVPPGFAPQRTEGDLMYVGELGVWWSSHPKNCDITVESLPVPISVFEACAESRPAN